jgi:fatty-acyl-CoA synthase
VHEAHGLVVADVVCLPPGHLPKTTSGKLQRRQTRERYLSGRLLTHGSRGSSVSTYSKLTLVRYMARSLWMRARRSLFPSFPRKNP